MLNIYILLMFRYIYLPKNEQIKQEMKIAIMKTVRINLNRA